MSEVTKKDEPINPLLDPNKKVSRSIMDKFSGALNETKIDEKKVESIVSEVGKETPKVEPVAKFESPEPKADVKSDPKVDPKAEASLVTSDSKPISNEASTAFRMLKQELRDSENQLKYLKTKYGDFENERKSLNDKIKEYEEKIKLSPTDYDKVKSQRDELAAEIAKLAWEKSPEFKEKFEKPIELARDKAKKSIYGTDINEADVELILNMPDGEERDARIDYIISTLSPSKVAKFSAALTEYQSLVDLKNRASNQHNEYLSRLDNDRKQKAMIAKENDQKIIDSALDRARSVIPFMQPIDGNEEYNQRINEVVLLAKRAWSGEGVTADNLAELTVAGSLLPVYAQELNKLYRSFKDVSDKLDLANEELSKIKQASPSVSAGGSPSGESKKSIFDKFKTGAGM